MHSCRSGQGGSTPGTRSCVWGKVWLGVHCQALPSLTRDASLPGSSVYPFAGWQPTLHQHAHIQASSCPFSMPRSSGSPPASSQEQAELLAAVSHCTQASEQVRTNLPWHRAGLGTLLASPCVSPAPSATPWLLHVGLSCLEPNIIPPANGHITQTPQNQPHW